MSVTSSSTKASGPVAHRHSATLLGRPHGVPAVLGHGFGCDQSMWARVAQELAEDRQVVLFDHVGAGASDPTAYSPVRHASLRGYAQDLVELVEALDLGPVAFVGHSASAMIGVLAAAQRPDLFSGLALVGGSPRYLDADGYVGGFSQTDVEGLLEAMEGNYLAWSQATAPVVMANAERPELTSELEASFARVDSGVAVAFARAIFLSDYRDELAAVSLPTLVVQSAEDPMVPEAVGEYLHRHLAGSRYLRLAATGHFPHVSAPEETTAALRAFLAELD